MSDWHFLVPGPLDRPTGGSHYDRRIIEGLRATGRTVGVDELPGAFPDADRIARAAATRALQRLPEGQRVVIDGLALGGLAECIGGQADRLRIHALIHHPLADETGTTPERARALLEAESRAIALAERVITTSDFTARRLETLGLHTGPVTVIPPGCDPRQRASGSAHGTPRLLCVASLTPRKAQHRLLEALATLTDRPWFCELVGTPELDPDYAAMLNDQRRALGLVDRVAFAGAVGPAALDAAYQSADLFILPSHYEGFGMVISEAIAYGLPVITTTGGALATTLPTGAGIAVSPDDASALGGAIASLLDDAGRRHQLTLGARRARERLSDWDQRVQQFIQCLEEG
mgnify:CR=1 FL=1